MTTTQPFICLSCRHFRSRTSMTLRPEEPLTCTAFPRGIPTEITSGVWDHNTSTGTDNGVTYTEDARYAQEAVDYYEWRNSTGFEAWQFMMQEVLDLEEQEPHDQ